MGKILKKKIRTRFSPSPTGNLHIGGVRTALFSWLYAKHLHGEFILRIEDTDKERSGKESTRSIVQSMKWLGLQYDFNPFYQSERLKIYRDACENLLKNGHAYKCYCTKKRIDSLRIAQNRFGRKPRYDHHCRNLSLFSKNKPYVVRLRAPKHGTTSFTDRTRGVIKSANSELDDLVLVRSDGIPTYHFTVVVDDWKMNITDIIRGDEHINSTFRQINILKAFGAEIPRYIHVSTILGEGKKKLSKRCGALSMMQYRKYGYLPESILNCLAKLGWSNGNTEIFSLCELVALFDVQGLGRAPSTFDYKKLNWFNQHYLKNSRKRRLLNFLRQESRDKDYDTKLFIKGVKSIVNIQTDREKNIRDIIGRSSYFFPRSIRYNPKKIRESLRKSTLIQAGKALIKIKYLIKWDIYSIQDAIQVAADISGVKKGILIKFVRNALTGVSNSLPIVNTLQIVGKKRSVIYLNSFLNFIDKNFKLT